MEERPFFLTAAFAIGALTISAAWFFGLFLVVGANHVYDLSPQQGRALGALFWWALFAPPVLLVGALVMALKEANGRQRPRQLFWRHAAPILGAVFVTGITYGGTWIFTASL